MIEVLYNPIDMLFRAIEFDNIQREYEQEIKQLEREEKGK